MSKARELIESVISEAASYAPPPPADIVRHAKKYKGHFFSANLSDQEWIFEFIDKEHAADFSKSIDGGVIRGYYSRYDGGYKVGVSPKNRSIFTDRMRTQYDA